MDDMHYLLTLSTKITPRFIRIPAQELFFSNRILAQELFCCNRVQHHHLIIQAGSTVTIMQADARHANCCK